MELVRLVLWVFICATRVICGHFALCASLCGHWWSFVVIFNLLKVTLLMEVLYAMLSKAFSTFMLFVHL